MAENEEITLQIEKEEFKVNKNLLCENSDYFRAMFSGNYIENHQEKIVIDVVDASSMKIIIKYMEMGLIDLYDYSLEKISEIAMAANFLQITELIKQIEYTLQSQLSRDNWIKIMSIAENSAFTKLEQYSAAFGLLSFKDMNTDSIQTLENLYWYLSHPYLYAWSELDVFKFGLKWATSRETSVDIIMMILCCLDLLKLTTNDLVEIKKLMDAYNLSLAAKVIDCLHEVSVTNSGLSIEYITENKSKLCEMFTERVYTEVLNLVKDTKSRTLKLTAAVSFWTKKDQKDDKKRIQMGTTLGSHHFIYTFSQQTGFESWLPIAEKNLWGWGFTQWGPMRLVLACGEHGRGTGMFMRDVKVYDILRDEWVSHGVQLPPGRHAGLTVLGDSLFIVGGVGAFRVILDKVIIYDLKARTYREVAKFHDAIQNPGLCTHDGQVYASGIEAIYRFEETEHDSKWVPVVRTNIRMSCMTSYKGFIYCTQSYFSNLYRFRPYVDRELEIVANFTNPPAAICNLGDRLIFFTRTVCGQTDAIAVEEYTGKCDCEKPLLIWSNEDTDLLINDVAGCCGLVMNTPPLCREVPPSHQRYLKLCANMM